MCAFTTTIWCIYYLAYLLLSVFTTVCERVRVGDTCVHLLLLFSVFTTWRIYYSVYLLPSVFTSQCFYYLAYLLLLSVFTTLIWHGLRRGIATERYPASYVKYRCRYRYRYRYRYRSISCIIYKIMYTKKWITHYMAHTSTHT